MKGKISATLFLGSHASSVLFAASNKVNHTPRESIISGRKEGLTPSRELL